jgi:hypothetical protein
MFVQNAFYKHTMDHYRRIDMYILIINYPELCQEYRLANTRFIQYVCNHDGSYMTMHAIDTQLYSLYFSKTAIL